MTVSELVRDLRAQRSASRDYAERSLALRREAWAALAQGQLIRAAKLEQAAHRANRAAMAELGDPEP